jgi:hypothetical protein
VRLLLALALALPLLAGCGGDRIDDYCQDLSAHRKEMSAMIDSTSPTALLSHRPMLHDLADKAPSDLADEWQVFLDALDDLDTAIRKAGVKPADFQDGKPPAGLSATDRKRITDAADRLASSDVADAASGIEQEARDVCKINLGV